VSTAEGQRKSSTRDTFESLVVTVILAVFGTTFILQAFKIPTGSMEDTLLIGDHLIVNKFIFASPTGPLASLMPYRAIRRGDIVVFKFPPSGGQKQPGEHFVKVGAIAQVHILFGKGHHLEGGDLSDRIRTDNHVARHKGEPCGKVL